MRHRLESNVVIMGGGRFYSEENFMDHVTRDLLYLNLKQTRNTFWKFQDFLGRMQSIEGRLREHEMQENDFQSLIKEIGWADNCKESQVGNILSLLKEVDVKLVKILKGLGEDPTTLEEERKAKVFSVRTIIAEGCLEK